MVVGICKIELMIHNNHSLKGKRQVTKALIEKIKNRFNVSIAELDYNDLWQRGVIGMCIIGNDRRHINSTLDRAMNFIDSLYLVDILDHSFEFIHING